jgi:hypothetical protein
MKLLSFDIEISNIFELKKNEDLEKYAPFNISVAATAIAGGEERVWYSKNEEGHPALNMAQEQANELLEYLQEMQQRDFMICAWNGLGFDLKWIGHNAKNMKLAAEIALNSYDPMFQFFNQKGFPVGLAKVAKGMGIEQTKLMDGADAPKEWADGKHEEVMKYCMGDCQMTNQIIAEILTKKRINWITAKGTTSSTPMPLLKPVHQIINEPMADQSWMDTPLPKSKFYEWAHEAKGLK